MTKEERAQLIAEIIRSTTINDSSSAWTRRGFYLFQGMFFSALITLFVWTVLDYLTGWDLVW